MNWKRIKKEESIQPRKGTYRDRDWKEQIAEECYHQCIYCAIHESRFGGIRNFHVEHYRPKSLPEFCDLTNDIKNLYYACSICNTFKGNNWPAEPNEDLSNISYPDPSVVNYSSIFRVNNENSKIEGIYISSKYLINKLYLNRPQLILERRYFNFLARFEVLINTFDKFKNDLDKLDQKTALDNCKEYSTLFIDLTLLLHKLEKTRPYSTSDVTKRKNLR